MWEKQSTLLKLELKLGQNRLERSGLPWEIAVKICNDIIGTLICIFHIFFKFEYL